MSISRDSAANGAMIGGLFGGDAIGALIGWRKLNISSTSSGGRCAIGAMVGASTTTAALMNRRSTSCATNGMMVGRPGSV